MKAAHARKKVNELQEAVLPSALCQSPIVRRPATGIPQNTISQGAEDGSEMGAFAREKNPIKERALLVKYLEFMPAGLVPVIVYVT